MKIRIKSFNGNPVVRGFYPRSGLRLLPGQEFEFEDSEESLFWDCIETGLVEEVRDRPQRPAPDQPKRGRPKKVEDENTQPG